MIEKLKIQKLNFEFNRKKVYNINIDTMIVIKTKNTILLDPRRVETGILFQSLLSFFERFVVARCNNPFFAFKKGFFLIVCKFSI
jgi:23S rRNA A1618 N6-methylase RlmF